jgi:3-deoxy-D-manno-octulosonic-acid transferase
MVDTTGELSAWQCLATQVVIGKSFLATGGQNPAEALMACKPVLFGPHMENFDALVNLLLREKGAVQVRDFACAGDRV